MEFTVIYDDVSKACFKVIYWDKKYNVLHVSNNFGYRHLTYSKTGTIRLKNPHDKYDYRYLKEDQINNYTIHKAGSYYAMVFTLEFDINVAKEQFAKYFDFIKNGDIFTTSPIVLV